MTKRAELKIAQLQAYHPEILFRMKRYGITSVSELARIADIPDNTASRILRGINEPGIFTCKRIAEALHMSLDSLIEILEELHRPSTGQCSINGEIISVDKSKEKSRTKTWRNV
jgi:transcriptional regulator with XRE-family HTH domain